MIDLNLSREAQSAISTIAQSVNIDPFLVAAISMVESGGNPYAMRFEPKWAYAFKEKEYAKPLGSSEETEKNAQMTSWGLMQVMGTVAREHGFKGWLTELCRPELGILYGCKHLRLKLDKYKNTWEAVAAYNAGSPRLTPDGKFENQYYVDRVVRTYHEITQSG